jgi:multicomponent K+:H+ antiporter subunit A
LAVCITFAWYSAPDLALTQLLVEVVTSVLLLLGLRWLPRRLEMVRADRHPTIRDRMRRAGDFTIALGAGLGIAVMAFVVMSRPMVEGIAQFFTTNAYSEGGGTNVVNVILVDFRAFDTLGEITVLGVVALTVYALLRRFRPAADTIDRPEQQVQSDRETTSHDAVRPDTFADALFVPGLIGRLLFPVIAVVAVYLFMQGHDLPGGGFVAGLTMSVTFILQYMLAGTRWVESHLTIRPVRWIGVGLLLALLTGMGAWVFGYPFLTSYFTYALVPMIGKIPLATALLFDFGVFALVVGATVLILIALAHQSTRSHRLSVPDATEQSPTLESHTEAPRLRDAT